MTAIVLELPSRRPQDTPAGHPVAEAAAIFLETGVTAAEVRRDHPGKPLFSALADAMDAMAVT
jgi:hypothetical protein